MGKLSHLEALVIGVVMYLLHFLTTDAGQAILREVIDELDALTPEIDELGLHQAAPLQSEPSVSSPQAALINRVVPVRPSRPPVKRGTPQEDR